MKHGASLIVLTLLFAGPAAADPLPVVDAARSRHAAVRPVGVDEVRWTDGFWAERYRVCRDSTLPSMWGLMLDSRYKPFYEHFLIAAGQAEGDYHGAPWNDGDFYKWIEAACWALAVRPDADLSAAVDKAVAAIAAAQRADGYVHTPVLIRNRNGDASAQPFQDRNDFEVYNMGHLMTAGCVHWRVTGDRRLLDAAQRAAAFLEDAFREPSPAMARQAVCPSHYMGVLDLYRATGERRYLDLAEHFLRLRNVAAGVSQHGGDDNQDRIPFLDQREAVGHAVRANYLYAGASDLYLETGDSALLAPLRAVWRSVTEKKLYVTGACGALYDGASPDASAKQGEITRVHQAYGRNYQLPNTTAHNETCAAIGAVLWNWRRFLADGEARRLDWMELSLYNAVLSGVSLDGDDYFYVNPLRVVDPLPVELRWSRQRQPFIVSFCCPPNIARTIMQSGGYAYSKSEDAVWVNLYGANTLRTTLGGAGFHLTQKTNYPWQGRVLLTIDKAPPAAVELRLRRPGWAEEFAVSINGAPVSGEDDQGFRVIKRPWRAGDQIEISMPMPVRLLESHPLVEENANQLAVKRGPIVYCLESADLPESTRLSDVGVSPATEFEARFHPDLLGGVVALTGELPVQPSRDWDSLYRPVDPDAKPTPRRVRLVPYFAWGNRGKSEMTVWLPRR